MDHDLLLDLAPLDDPEPPGFGPLRAEEAVRRAAHRQSRRARLVAGAVVAVAVVAALGIAALPEDPPTATLNVALPPSATEPTSSEFPSATVSPTVAPPTTAAPVVATAGPTEPGPPSSSPTAAPGVPSTTVPVPNPAPMVGPATTLAPARATGQPPESTRPAPPGLRFTLTLDADQVPLGGSVRGVVRLENNRSTAVTLQGGGCSTMWRADLYAGGRQAPSPAVICPMALRTVVAAGSVEQAVVQLRADPSLRPGTYDAFTTIVVAEDGLGIHTERVVVAVVRP